jgi:hypothetical protein
MKPTLVVVDTPPSPSGTYPLRAAIDTALDKVLTPSANSILFIVSHRDGPIALKAVPDIEVLVDGLLMAACEARGWNKEE